MSETRTDYMLDHMAGLDFASQPSRLTSLRQATMQVERGVTITAGIDSEGHFLWLVQASNMTTGEFWQAVVFERRELQWFVDTFAECIAPASSA